MARTGNHQGPVAAIGLMSGTSMDGIDIALIRTDGERVVERGPGGTSAYEPAFRRRLAAALDMAAGIRSREQRPGELVDIERELTRRHGEAVNTFLAAQRLRPAEIAVIGFHGQTVLHRPEDRLTIQLGDGKALAAALGLPIAWDLRAADVAAGGQGAPLVPAFHAGVFRAAAPRAVVNVGGIANLTGLPAQGDDSPLLGFDCGPGNVLLDAWALEHLGEPVDRGGRWAAGGEVDPSLLARLLEDPYFRMPPPKSTGRDRFNAQWLRERLRGARAEPRDIQATLTRLTALAIGQAIERYFAEAEDVVVCGGGAFNATLMRMLGETCAPRPVLGSDALGIAPEQVEALAFAWLAHEHLAGRAANVPAVTGARGPRRLGALYPR